MNKENKHNKELVLSILIPSFNDEDYIKQCLESILMNISEEFEVILNDDCSDDKTLEIANSFNDPRLKCNLAHTKLGTVDNWKKCCHLAKGKYIYIVGSDDYISPYGIDKIIPLLDGTSIVTAPINCFSDTDNKTLDMQSTQEMITKIFLNLSEAEGKNLLLYSNHDELVHNFFPRHMMYRVFDLASGSGNTVFFYWVLLLFNKSKIVCSRDIFLNKRYLKRSKRETWNSEYHTVSIKNPLKYITKSIKDLYNTIHVLRISKDYILFLKILLLPIRQIEKKGGFHGLTNKNSSFYHLGTLPSFLLSPFFEIYKFFKKN
jgi:glycosyltransferase involved in cell wall biosynthesis